MYQSSEEILPIAYRALLKMRGLLLYSVLVYNLFALVGASHSDLLLQRLSKYIDSDSTNNSESYSLSRHSTRRLLITT